MSFRETFQAKLDVEVKRLREDHPEYVISDIMEALTATRWEIRSSLKRLGIEMPDGRRSRLNPEN